MNNNPSIREIGVVFKTHLDIGFTNLAENIVQAYIEDFIPRALTLAERTRETPHRFVWTTGSWLVWKYLEVASRRRRQRMENAIHAGDFYWHALPFTTHTELMSRDLFIAGLAISKRLDQRFGRTTCSAKMTDVPGHTCAMVPLLAAAGVTYLDIGTNPASAVPDVPPLFRWQFDHREIVVSYSGDYGRLIQLPGKKALSVNFTGDNHGPQTPEEISRVYEALLALHPGAKVKPVNLSDVGRFVWKHRDELPVVQKEIGDSWIHGAGTDPLKVSRYRAISRLRSEWLRTGLLQRDGAVDQKLSEALLLTAEHTWGMDEKTFLKDTKNYRRRDFDRARKTKPFRVMETSWREQRRYVEDGIQKLPARLHPSAQRELVELRPRLARKTGWVTARLLAEEVLDGWLLSIDQTSGALKKIVSPTGRVITCGRNVMAGLVYQTYSANDYKRFYAQYIRGEADWSRQDFTKPGLPADVKSMRLQPTVIHVFRHRSGKRLKVELGFPASAVKSAGAPARMFMEWSVEDQALALRVEWIDKPANRMPEALWLEFCPVVPSRNAWEVEKLGRWIRFNDVVKRGGTTLHAMDQSVRSGAISVRSLDAPLVAPGTGSLLDYTSRVPNAAAGISINLYNNIWGTNFPMWYEDNAVFRFLFTCG
jgi:hypothetical protein